MEKLYSLNDYLKEEYGEKVYKIAIDAGMTCPNRDGSIGTGGCIFCSVGGSGEFAGDSGLSVKDQIADGKRIIQKKAPSCRKFIAYFQAYTNTYGPIDKLRKLYEEAIEQNDVVILSIATRPDCISDDVLALLTECNKKKPVWVELGLQSIHSKTADHIRRGFSLDCYDIAVDRLSNSGIKVITHVIFGFPWETKEQMLQTVDHVCAGNVFGIKIQMLQVLSGTDLAKEYENSHFSLLSLDEYSHLVAKAIKAMPEGMVVHRMTGDPPKKLLISPSWTADKKRVLNTIKKLL